MFLHTSEGCTWPIGKATALADTDSDLHENAGQDWKLVADSPVGQMLMSKHALPALSPWEPSPRSANKAAEIKEPKRVDGPKNTWQASLKEPSLNPAPVESSYSFTINCNMDAACIPLAFNF